MLTPYHYTQLSASYNNQLSPEFWQNFSYEWNIPYAQIRYSNNNMDAAVSPTLTGYFHYKIRAKNPCGYSNWKQRLFEVKETNSGNRVFIAPN